MLKVVIITGGAYAAVISDTFIVSDEHYVVVITQESDVRIQKLKDHEILSLQEAMKLEVDKIERAEDHWATHAPARAIMGLTKLTEIKQLAEDNWFAPEYITPLERSMRIGSCSNNTTKV